jgi:hypothetical protein
MGQVDGGVLLACWRLLGLQVHARMSIHNTSIRELNVQLAWRPRPACCCSRGRGHAVPLPPSSCAAAQWRKALYDHGPLNLLLPPSIGGILIDRRRLTRATLGVGLRSRPDQRRSKGPHIIAFLLAMRTKLGACCPHGTELKQARPQHISEKPPAAWLVARRVRVQAAANLEPAGHDAKPPTR